MSVKRKLHLMAAPSSPGQSIVCEPSAYMLRSSPSCSCPMPLMKLTICTRSICCACACSHSSKHYVLLGQCIVMESHSYKSCLLLCSNVTLPRCAGMQVLVAALIPEQVLPQILRL